MKTFYITVIIGLLLASCAATKRDLPPVENKLQDAVTDVKTAVASVNAKLDTVFDQQEQLIDQGVKQAPDLTVWPPFKLTINQGREAADEINQLNKTIDILQDQIVRERQRYDVDIAEKDKIIAAKDESLKLQMLAEAKTQRRYAMICMMLSIFAAAATVGLYKYQLGVASFLAGLASSAFIVATIALYAAAAFQAFVAMYINWVITGILVIAGIILCAIIYELLRERRDKKLAIWAGELVKEAGGWTQEVKDKLKAALPVKMQQEVTAFKRELANSAKS